MSSSNCGFIATQQLCTHKDFLGGLRNCRGWASLDMSFKTPLPSRCSIFIHLQVSNRPSGQHSVSLPVNPAVAGHLWCIDKIWSRLRVTLPPFSFSPRFCSCPLCLTLPPDLFVTIQMAFIIWQPYSWYSSCLAWLSTSASAIYRVCFSLLCVVNDDKPSL